MKKIIIGILLGLVLGVFGACVWLRPAGSKESATATESSPPKPEEKANPLQLNAAKRQANGIVLAKPTEAEIAPQLEVFGRVIDATGFINAISDVDAVRAASIASHKELDRVKQLFAAEGNASEQALETAEATASRDQAALEAASAKLVTGWVHPRKNVEDFDRVLNELKEGGALARIDLSADQAIAADVNTVKISLVGSHNWIDADILGSASVSDAQLQGSSYLAIVRDHPFAAGAPLRVLIHTEGPSSHVLAVPPGAVVYHQGSAWVYVLGEEDVFERKLVQIGKPVESGLSVTGLEESEQVVIKGAQQLLSAELQAGGATEED